MDEEKKAAVAEVGPTSEALRKVDPRPTYEELVAAMRSARDELGVPTDGYPASVANAYEHLNDALGRVGDYA